MGKYSFLVIDIPFIRSLLSVIGCRNLPKMDMIGKSDPYVTLELLPYSFYRKAQNRVRTVTQKRTLNPEYDETFDWFVSNHRQIKMISYFLHCLIN